MPVETASALYAEFLGIFATASAIPSAAASNDGKLAYVSDTKQLMLSNGTSWVAVTTKRVETYNGTTNASGDYTVTFATQYGTTPHVNPVCYPPADSTTRVRVTAVSTTGFTVKTERNPSVDVLGIAVLQVGTANVTGVPVRVVVVES